MHTTPNPLTDALGAWVLALALPGCYGALEPAPAQTEYDELAGAVTIEGVQVAPAVIHPGDRVVLRDPEKPSKSSPVPLYYWDACGGHIEEDEVASRQAYWIAPDAPGTYAVTMNVTNAYRHDPSRVLNLCVAAPGEDGCAPSDPAPKLERLVAEPEFVNEGSCVGNCQTTLVAELTGEADAGVVHRWSVRQGSLEGGGAEVDWSLPVVGCCAEVYSAAVTVCDAAHNGATGFVDVTVEPQ